MKFVLRPLSFAVFILVGSFLVANGQSSAFTYQGKLNSSGSPVTGTYEMQFRLMNAATNGSQVGNTKTEPSIEVTNGLFSVSLDFGTSVFDGADRFIEIGVRQAASTDPFTILGPLPWITSTPYSIRSANSSNADNATTLGGLNAAEYLTIANADNAYIKNGNTQQTADFNVTGNGTIGGTATANIIQAATEFRIGVEPVISLGTGADNLFVGPLAGQANPIGTANTFVGRSAGYNTTSGTANVFSGRSSGFQNTSGSDNSFYGTQSGRDNTSGINNSFFGRSAGISNSTGEANSYFGAFAGQANSTGSANSFFGVSAGYNNTGTGNSFFGRSSGFQNTSGDENAFFGTQAGRDNTTGSRNTFLGRSAGLSNTNGLENVFVGNNAGRSNTTGYYNIFMGSEAGYGNTTGMANIYIGHLTQGSPNGGGNIYIGTGVGGTGGGNFNTYIGNSAGLSQNGTGNTAIGDYSGNTGGSSGPSDYTVGIGYHSETGSGNESIAIGHNSKILIGDYSIAIGSGANVIDDNSIAIGHNANVSFNATNSVAIGSNAVTALPNTIVLGTAAETVRIPGNLIVTGTVSKGGGSFRIDHPLDPENKFLYHSFVESPDMMNVYNGNITTDARGEAIVTLPAYFEALNKNFRYQLTVLGQFSQAIVGEKITGNRFVIRTDKPNVEVSWQVTGIRKDMFAEENRIQVEVEKNEQDRKEQQR